MPFHLESLWGVTLWWQNKIVRVGKNSGPVLSRLWTKVHEILRQRRRPFVFSTTLPVCLYHVSFSRNSPLSLEVVENWTICKSFWPTIFWGGTTPTFLRQIVSATYHPPFVKVWLSSVCWSPSAKPGKMKCMQNLQNVDKNYGPIWSRLQTKMLFWDDVADSSCFATHLPAYVCRISIRRFMDFSAAERIGGMKLCILVRLLSGQFFSHFGEYISVS